MEAAESMLGTWKEKEVEAAAKKLGLTDEITKELKWLYALRHSDEVAHAVIYMKKSEEEFRKLYDERHEKIRRAENVTRATIDHVLNAAARP